MVDFVFAMGTLLLLFIEVYALVYFLNQCECMRLSQDEEEGAYAGNERLSLAKRRADAKKGNNTC